MKVMTTSKLDRYGLALHTTTPQLGIAISNFKDDNRCQIWDLGHDLSSYLHQYLLEFLHPQTWQDLSFIAVAKGPGGFTGTRIGVTVAKTLGQQLNIPVFGISNLAAVAWHEHHKFPQISSIAVQMDARRDRLFAGIYQISCQGDRLEEYLSDTVISSEIWQEKLASLATNYQLIDAGDNLAMTVTSILELAHLEYKRGNLSQWLDLVPYYGQHPVNLAK